MATKKEKEIEYHVYQEMIKKLSEVYSMEAERFTSELLKVNNDFLPGERESLEEAGKILLRIKMRSRLSRKY